MKLDMKNVRFELAPTEALDALSDFPYELLRRVMDVRAALITDRSSLWDFREMDFGKKTGTAGDYKTPVFERIRREYGVDVSDITDGNIVRVCLALIGRDPRAHRNTLNLG